MLIRRQVGGVIGGRRLYTFELPPFTIVQMVFGTVVVTVVSNIKFKLSPSL
jgi:hypothetical protein